MLYIGEELEAGDGPASTWIKSWSVLPDAMSSRSALPFVAMSMRLREPGIEASISGAILFDETLRQEALSSEPFVALMQRAGILFGIKVDTGAKAPACAAGETVSLAIERGPISVETLLEELWPGAEPVAATRALRMTVHRLRKALDDADVLRAVSGGYRLSENVAVDVLEAEHAVAAIGRLPSLVNRDRHRLDTVPSSSHRAPSCARNRKGRAFGRRRSPTSGIALACS